MKDDWNFGRKKNENTPQVQEPVSVSEPVSVPVSVSEPVSVPVSVSEPVSEPAPVPAPVSVPAPVEAPVKPDTDPLSYEGLLYRDKHNIETNGPKKESTSEYTSDINYRDGYFKNNEPAKVKNTNTNGNAYESGNYRYYGGKRKQRNSKKRTTKKRRNSKKRRSNKKR